MCWLVSGPGPPLPQHSLVGTARLPTHTHSALTCMCIGGLRLIPMSLTQVFHMNGYVGLNQKAPLVFHLQTTQSKPPGLPASIVPGQWKTLRSYSSPLTYSSVVLPPTHPHTPFLSNPQPLMPASKQASGNVGCLPGTHTQLLVGSQTPSVGMLVSQQLSPKIL